MKTIILLQRLVLVLAVVVIVIGVMLMFRGVNASWQKRTKQQIMAKNYQNAMRVVEVLGNVQKVDLLISQANILASGYDYDSAIAHIQAFPDYGQVPSLVTAIQDYEIARSQVVAYADVTTITHIFFHSLIVDTSKAFDGDAKQDGYNKMMATVYEFEKVIQQMYDKGYVLVSMKDMAYLEVGEDGNERFVQGEILLPAGKKPFVLSIDDVSYYEYMDGDGFASRLVLDAGGKPVNEMILDDGSVVTGSFDVMAILEDFIAKHPDFSYRNARGMIALTGYEGVLGYRTAPSYANSDTYQQDIEDARRVAEALKSYGWEFANHSYGHIDMGVESLETVMEDTQRWKQTVEPIVGATDIMIFAFGADIGGWQGYSGDKFEYLSSEGYDYFCNVDSAPYWVQITDRYVRQGRRNIDGVRMYYDMIDANVDFLSDLFDVEAVFDPARPIPVPPM